MAQTMVEDQGFHKAVKKAGESLDLDFLKSFAFEADSLASKY
jgi:hypothetical protein